MNNIVWGNPTTKYMVYLQSEGKYDYLLENLKQYNPPTNDSDATREELKQLILIQRHHAQHNSALVEKYWDYDSNLKDVFIVYCNEIIGEDKTPIINSLIEETKTLLMKLKYHFNRARPFQLAYYYKARLVPVTNYTSDTPSYPSGHAFQAHLLCEVIGSLYPTHYQDLNKLAMDISRSRLFFGLHYQSDIDFSIFVANALLKDKKFTKEYGI
jgi:hypothetical protein